MRPTLTREGRDVGVFTMDRDGHYSWHGSEDEQERFDEVKRIIEGLGEPSAVGRGGPHGSSAFDYLPVPASTRALLREVLRRVPVSTAGPRSPRSTGD